MSGLLNIGGDANDASYRYKMPKLVTKVEGRGNGIKTVIVNMVDIAKALHCEPGYPTKFFGIELGAQSKFNPSTERAIVNGCFEQRDMAKMLNKFIDIFILCPTCHLPEIKMKVKRTNIKIDCAACGHNGVLQTKHKLLTFILKDHAEVGKGKKDKKDKDKKKKKKGEEEEKEGEAVVVDKKEKKKKEKKEEEEVEWFTDTSKTAQKERKETEFVEMSEGNGYLEKVDAIIANAGGEGKDLSACTQLKIYMASGERDIQGIISELKRLQMARGLDEPQKIKVLLEAVIDTNENIVDEYKKNAKILSAITAERTAATILLSCIEEQVGVVCPKLLARTPLIVQCLYEEEVLDEETIISWYEAPPESSWLVNKDVAVAVRAKATPFITWLQEAESEDESD